MMDNLEEIVDKMIQKDNGVDPKSPLSIEAQVAARRRYYESLLTEESLKDELNLATRTIQKELIPGLPPDEGKELELEIRQAGQKLERICEDELDSVGPQLLGMSDRSMDRLFEAAEAYYMASHFRRSQALFTLLSLFHLQHPGYWLGRGASEHKLGLYQQACNSYRVALAIEPSQVEACLLLAEASIDAGQELEAQAALESAMKITQLVHEPDRGVIDLADQLSQRLNPKK